MSHNPPSATPPRPTRRTLLATGAGALLLSGVAGPAILAPGAVAAQSAAPAPTRGGTMTIMFYAEPPSLVSIVSTNSLVCSAKVTEGLLWYDNAMRPQPQLATSYEIARTG